MLVSFRKIISSRDDNREQEHIQTSICNIDGEATGLEDGN
jgi:hypothetical protein